MKTMPAAMAMGMTVCGQSRVTMSITSTKKYRPTHELGTAT